MNTSMLFNVALVAALIAFLFRIGMVILAKHIDPYNPISAMPIFPATLPRRIFIDFKIIIDNSKFDSVVGISCITYLFLIFTASVSLLSYALVGLVK